MKKDMDVKIVVKYRDGTKIETNGGQHETLGQLFLRTMNRNQIDCADTLSDMIKKMDHKSKRRYATMCGGDE